MTSVSFSNRGSIMFGKRGNGGHGDTGLGLQNYTSTDAQPASLDGAMDIDACVDPSSPASLSKAPSSATQSSVATTLTERADSQANAVARATVARDLIPPPDIRVLAADVEKESQKVRSLYQSGEAINWEDGERHSYCEHLEPTPEVPVEEDENDSYGLPWLPMAASSYYSFFANLVVRL